MKAIAKAYLAHQGRIVSPNTVIDLTADQIKRLGDKVEKVETPKKSEPKAKSKEVKTEEKE